MSIIIARSGTASVPIQKSGLCVTWNAKPYLRALQMADLRCLDSIPWNKLPQFSTTYTIDNLPSLIHDSCYVDHLNIPELQNEYAFLRIMLLTIL